MAISNISELCRLCLEESDALYKLDSDFCILVMESGASITIADAMKYLSLDITVPPLKPAGAEPKLKKEETEGEDEPDEEKGEEPEPDEVDDPGLPKSLCQECLEKLQSAYEFKFRCEENRSFLRNYLQECADSKLAEERAAKEAALLALNVDIDNLDSLPDKLVLKQVTKDKKPRKPRDPAKPKVVRRRRVAEKNIIIAEDSQVESPAYIRKIITTPEQSPEQKHVNKRKSKHVIIEDIFVGEKVSKKPEESKENDGTDDGGLKELPTKRKYTKRVRDDDEPIFEDDDEVVEKPVKKRGRPKKIKEPEPVEADEEEEEEK